MGAGNGKPFTADLAQFTPLTMRISRITFTIGFLHPFLCVQTIILPCLETETLIAVLRQIDLYQAQKNDFCHAFALRL